MILPHIHIGSIFSTYHFSGTISLQDNLHDLQKSLGVLEVNPMASILYLMEVIVCHLRVETFVLLLLGLTVVRRFLAVDQFNWFFPISRCEIQCVTADVIVALISQHFDIGSPTIFSILLDHITFEKTCYIFAKGSLLDLFVDISDRLSHIYLCHLL